jgi:hypothetical protein
VTTSSFTLMANTTYLVFAFTNSAAGDSATFSSTFTGSPAFTPIGTGSLNYNTSDYVFGQWLNSGANTSTGTITVTFVKTTHQAYLQVIKLSGNNLSTPIAQSAYTSGNSNSYTANLPASPSSGDQEVVFVSGQQDLGGTAPTANPPMSNLIYVHNGSGSAASYARSNATQNTSFSGNNANWGTIAVDINHP